MENIKVSIESPVKYYDFVDQHGEALATLRFVPTDIDIIERYREASVVFEKMRDERKLVEYAQYVNNYYGTPKEYVEQKMAEGKDVILEIEIQGALKVKEKYPDTLLMFVTPPSAQVLKDRLVGRGTETAEVIDSRMKRAVEESQGVEKYDYLVINDDLERCAKEMHSIIQGEHDRVSRNADFIDDIRKELKEL